jgi:simple sugar transport system ATP-binding protein
MVLTAPLAELTRDDLIAAMVGSAQVRAAASSGPPGPPDQPGPLPPRDSRRQPERPDDAAVLTIENLTSDSAKGRLSGVSLQVRKGEIVGVTGLLSAGVATIGRTIAGAESRLGGEVWLRGALVPAGRRDLAQRAGIGYIPEDRRTEGFVPHLGVAENVTMTIMGRLADPLGLMRPGRRAAAAAPITARLSLVSSGPGQPVEELSGGNQQKITVARTLAHEPTLIVAITPTRGVDVASKVLLLDSLADVAKSRGAGVLLCSDELSDLVICDRVIVLVRGQVFAEFTEPPFDRDELIVATEGLSGSALDAAYDTPAEHGTAAHDTPKEAAE